MRTALLWLAAVTVALTAACSSSDGGPGPALDVGQLRSKLVTAAALGATSDARGASEKTTSQTTIVRQGFTGPDGLFVYITLIAGANPKAASSAFIEFAHAAAAFFQPGVTRTGLTLGDAGFILDGNERGTTTPATEFVYVRGSVVVEIEATHTTGSPTPLTSADRALTRKAAELQDAKLR